MENAVRQSVICWRFDCGIESRWVGGRLAVTGCCRSSWWCLLHPWRWCPSQCRSQPAGPWIPSAWTGRNLEQNGTAWGGWPQIKEELMQSIGRTSGDPYYAKFILQITATICHEQRTMDERNPFITSFVCSAFQTMAAKADSSGGQPYVMSQRVSSSTSFWLPTAPTTVPALFCRLKHMEASAKHQQQIMAFNVFCFRLFLVINHQTSTV